MSSSAALKTFALSNDIVNVSAQDEIYKFDVAADKLINREMPWAKELSGPTFD
jgi:COP9 signalosome complex subunit 5